MFRSLPRIFHPFSLLFLLAQLVFDMWTAVPPLSSDRSSPSLSASRQPDTRLLPERTHSRSHKQPAYLQRESTHTRVLRKTERELYLKSVVRSDLSAEEELRILTALLSLSVSRCCSPSSNPTASSRCCSDCSRYFILLIHLSITAVLSNQPSHYFTLSGKKRPRWGTDRLY